MSKATGNYKGESRFQKLSFLLILTVISLGFLLMLRHFIMPLLLAAVFTGLSYPLYEFLRRRLRNSTLAAFSTLLILILVILLPISAVIFVAYREAQNVLSVVDLALLRTTVDQAIQHLRDRFPTVFAHLGPQNISHITDQGLQWLANWLPNQLAKIALATAGNIIEGFLMLFMMFYFYLDGKRILDVIMRWSPLRDDYETILLHNFLAVSRATLTGLLVIGVIQGTFGALMFWVTGLSSPVLLGALIVFCSIIPVVGVGIIWIPAIGYLFFEGHNGAGIVLLSVGAVVISIIDNVLRPQIVGKNIKMHELMVLISTLAGLELFGLPGFVMGPVLASLFLSIWNMFEEVFAKELERNRVPIPDIE